jgi:hypothetical protein
MPSHHACLYLYERHAGPAGALNGSTSPRWPTRNLRVHAWQSNLPGE